ncbi:glycosyltransferase family 4 protein [Microbacterium sp. UBA3486]|uniref:glycosyltransferase family 4 protein n=1 Tax=Microbacterium sp. UBA3486 TaxID=1946947 RepID=UPI0025E7B741|nr:glycosyltransferase family 4 protein [Microbacterium sp. UBA3486]
MVPEQGLVSPADPARILIGVTADVSVGLLSGLPQRLAADGWEVHVASSPGERLETLGAEQGVTVHSLPMAREIDIVRDVRGLREWIRLIRRLRPDVVFAGTPKAGLLGITAARLLGVRTRVYHLRGLRLETAAGTTRRVLTIMERLTIRLATTTLAVSPSLRKRVLSLGLASDPRVTVLGHGSSNGVDVDRFRPGNAGARVEGLIPDVPVIGFVGRLNHDKGLDVLAAACRVLDDERVEYQLLIVGGIDGAELGAFSSLRRAPVVLGAVADTSMYYPLMRALCLPTLREGFPNVVLEAGATGIAVVTTDATGAVDSVIPERTGLMVPAGDARQLAGALQRVIEDPRLAEGLGAAARDFVVENFRRDLVHASVSDFLRREMVRGRR